MKIDTTEKFCVILLAMGGPDSLDDIKKYLYNIFSDRTIIKLPGGPIFQKPFAKMISSLRYKNVQHHYSLIGGSSPLLQWTEAQKKHLEFTLAPTFPGFTCYIGMRYFTPYIPDVVEEAIRDGFKQIVFLPMYPQYCIATTGSSFNEAKKVLKKHPDIKSEYIGDFHKHDGYIELFRKYIEDNITPDDTLLFSAHSIPQSFVDDGDPYVMQIEKTAELAANGSEYYLSFQSRTGPVKWVGPDTIAETTRLLEDKTRKLFVVPISFVCDHIETMYELDIELKQLVGEENGNRIRRMPMFNDDQQFGLALADIIMEAVNGRS